MDKWDACGDDVCVNTRRRRFCDEVSRVQDVFRAHRNGKSFSKRQGGVHSLLFIFNDLQVGNGVWSIGINHKMYKMEEEPDLIVRVATPADVKYVYAILQEMERSAQERGTGIARRKPQLLCRKVYEGKAVIALTRTGVWIGFSYIESWSEGAFVSNSGLIVDPRYRGMHVASRIKEMIFALSRRLYPGANIFSITTGAAVLSMNHQLGFRPVTYVEITKDPVFWDQCKACVNYPLLESKGRKICLCTAMMYYPEEKKYVYA